MGAKKVETYCGNSINSVPDEILGQILSLLPTKIAASTSVLSKRWRNLLPLVHNLDLDDSMVLSSGRISREQVGCFIDFVERILVLLGDSPIKKLSLKRMASMDESQFHHLIYNVLQRGALELHLSKAVFPCIEPEFFFSKTLVKLTISDGCYWMNTRPPGGVLFPALRTLSLFQVCYAGFAGADLYGCLLSSPLLEELNICEYDPRQPGWCQVVRCSSIQRLSIFFRPRDLGVYDCHVIKAPSLLYLDYSSYVAEDYDFQCDSLVEARLDLTLWKYNNDIPLVNSYYGYDSTKGNAWGDATKLIAAVRNVVTLHLSADSLEVFHYCCKSMPHFNNLVKLSFESHKERNWQVLPLLLKKSPNLETLVIKGLVHKVAKGCGNVCICKHVKNKRRRKKSCLLSCRVKVLMVYGYEGSCMEVKQMRHFMENLKYLEVVKVKVSSGSQQDKCLSITNDLMKLIPTTSSKCKIQFI